MKVMVTGAAGFVGRALLGYLLTLKETEPIEIIAVVRSNPEQLKNDFPSIQVSQLELHSSPLQLSLFHSVDIVFHLAAQASIGASESDYQNNVVATQRLVGALKDSPRLKRLVFSSTVGAVDRAPKDPCSAPLQDGATPNPLTRYGRSKLECERILNESGLPITIARLTWVYGPNMRRNSHIHVLLDAVLKRRLSTKLNLPGRVSTIYVDDAARALWFLGSCSEAIGKTIFLADPEPVSIGTLIRTLGDCVGARTCIIPVPRTVVKLLAPLRRFLPFSAQCAFFDVLAVTPQTSISLGFRPIVPLERGLRQLAAWNGRQHTNGQLALITGAASGIGRSLAGQCAARGYEVFLVDRNQNVSRLANDMYGKSICLDLTETKARTQWLGGFFSENPHCSLVINCAGIGFRGAFVDSAIGESRSTLRLNCEALVEISHGALSHFKSRGRGTLVNVASSAAFQPLPFMAVYAASKAFVLSFTEALGYENRERQLRIIALSPSGTKTGFQQSAGVRVVPEERLLDPAEIGVALFPELESTKTVIMVGKRNGVQSMIARMLPRRVLVRLWGKLMEGMR